MPVQRFKPIQKDFPTFDCDAHVIEPPEVWTRASEHLTKEELADLKDSCWYDAESGQLFLEGNWRGTSGISRRNGSQTSAVTITGPGVTTKVERAIFARNMRPETALSNEEADYLDHRGAWEPGARLRDMDMQGIDQVMVIPTGPNSYLHQLQNAFGSRAFCRAYNEWVAEYCREDPERLFAAALVPITNPIFATQELRRVADKGFKVAMVRPHDAHGNYPLQPKYEPVWKAMEETGTIYGMHTFPVGLNGPIGLTEQRTPGELLERASAAPTVTGKPQSFPTNLINFMYEGSTWVVMALMGGLFERYPNLRAAVFECNATWLTTVLAECDKAFRLYRKEREIPLKRLPSEVFFEHCFIGFEGDEEFVYGLPDYYEDIAVWASDVYHHDGADAWSAIERMRRMELPEAVQRKFMGDNARRMYNIKPIERVIRDRVTEIQRPEWWPTDEEIQSALRPEATLVRG